VATGQEPSVVADHDSAAGKVFKSLSRARRVFTIQIVGGFVKKKDIGPLLQHSRQMDAVPFASRKCPDLLLLIGSREVKPCHVGPGVDLSLPSWTRILTPK